MPITGRIIEEQKNFFVVDTPSGQVTATTSGGLKKQRTRVCTGDIVEVTIINTAPLRGVITTVGKRSSFIKRPALANCSHLFCICTWREPPLNLETLDRLLFCAQVYELQPCIVFNKIDLNTDKDDREMHKIINSYTAIGYPLFSTSAATHEGIDALVDFCADRISVCAGLSGVGKSTLLSVIFPDVNFRTGPLSSDSTRGIHTTTSIRLLPLRGGGYIADTPGLAFIDLPAVPEEDVVLYFPELAQCIGKCRFNDCIHDNEPGCFVAEKIEEGTIAPWRHNHYLKIRREMAERRKLYR
ncbi:MAG: ribosome small subunit-dependent GTPase A [Chitinispirillaceae bacterium]|nr:ribosome small subunit-dependent GTPase A [Chitinispirillaceae bacterium]